MTTVERPAEIDVPPGAVLFLHSCASTDAMAGFEDPVEALDGAVHSALLSSGFRLVRECRAMDSVVNCPPNPAAWLGCGAEYAVAASLVDLRLDEQIMDGEIRRGDERGLTKTARKGVLRCTVQFQVSDLERKKILANTDESVTLNAETFSANAAPPLLRRDSLLGIAMSRVAASFRSRLAPQTDRVAVSFLFDSRYPEISRGIKEAERGRWANAVEVFQQIADAAKSRGDEDRMLYNLGIAYQYARNFRAAYDTFKKAESIQSSARYRNAMDAVLKMEEESGP
jgi:tetratricopeptide (TPR) repeat protein